MQRSGSISSSRAIHLVRNTLRGNLGESVRSRLWSRPTQDRVAGRGCSLASTAQPQTRADDAAKRPRAALIVEDEAIIAMSLEDGLADAGFVISGSFLACADALRFLEHTVPDVAILDAVLSDGPCLDLARELRARGVPFLIYSGAEEFRDHAPELKGVPWLEKPAPLQTVLKCIHGLIG